MFPIKFTFCNLQSSLLNLTLSYSSKISPLIISKISSTLSSSHFSGEIRQILTSFCFPNVRIYCFSLSYVVIKWKHFGFWTVDETKQATWGHHNGLICPSFVTTLRLNNCNWKRTDRLTDNGNNCWLQQHYWSTATCSLSGCFGLYSLYKLILRDFIRNVLCYVYFFTFQISVSASQTRYQSSSTLDPTPADFSCSKQHLSPGCCSIFDSHLHHNMGPWA